MATTKYYVGTMNIDIFKGGAENDIFEFTDVTFQKGDVISGGGGTNALVLANEESGGIAYDSKALAGLSNIQLLALGTDGGGGFEFTFTDAFATTNKETAFGILGTTLTGAAGFLHVDAHLVHKIAFSIAGSLEGEDRLIGGALDDTFLFAQNSLDVEDHLDGGAGNDTLVLNGAGGVTHVKDGPDHVNPIGSTYLGDVKHIENIVVTNLTAGQTRTIGFGNGIGSVLYAGSGVLNITTDKNYSAGTPAAAIDGSLDIDGSKLTSLQPIYVTAGNGANTIVAGAGADHLSGGKLADLFDGGTGNDMLNGADGNDYLHGGVGADNIAGGNGNDIIAISDNVFNSKGEFYKDTITGGAGNDALLFNASGDVHLTEAVLKLSNVSGIEILAFETANTDNSLVLSNDFVVKNHAASKNLLIAQAPSSGFSNTFAVDARHVTDTHYGIDVAISYTTIDKIYGGAGNDIVEYHGTGNESGLDYGDDLRGGAGIDTLALAAGSTSTFSTNVTGFERIVLHAPSAAQGGDTLTQVYVDTASAMTIDARALTSGGDTADLEGVSADPNTGVAHISKGALTIYGGAGADTIVGGAGSDLIQGGAGADFLFGYGGKDLITGGAGADLFGFFAAKDSPAGTNRDQLLDFSHAQGDKLVLYYVEQATGQAFHYAGEHAFTKSAGEIVSGIANGHTIVSLDIDGNGVADLQMDLTGSIHLAAGDFII